MNEPEWFEPSGAICSTHGSNITVINSIINGVDVDQDESSNTNITDFCGDDLSPSPSFGADLHIRADSPCIGAGDPSVAPGIDIDGEPRPKDGPIDIGADQFVDSDGDQMPDYWEKLHVVEYPDNDEDADGLSNLDEYHLGTNPKKAQHIIEPAFGGIVYGNGRHQASDGTISIRDGDTINEQNHSAFLVFDISNAAEIKNAAIRLTLTAFDSQDHHENIVVRKVDTAAATLSKDFSGKTGIDIYNNLSDGTTLGKYTIKASNVGTVLNIQLNQLAVKAIQMAAENSEQFVISLTTTTKYFTQNSFGKVNETGTHQLVLDKE